MWARSLRSGLCLAVALICGGVPAVVGATTEDDPAWFQSTTQRMFDAVGTGDKAVWDGLLDDACTITTEDGEVLDRGKFLADLRPLPSGFSGGIKVRDLTVRRVSDAAVVHYWLDEWEEIFGQRLKTIYVETDVWRRRGDSWKVVAQQVTVVPRDLEPVKVDSAGWGALVGDYRLSEQTTRRYHVFLRDGALYGGNDVDKATLLIPLGPLVFFQKGSIHWMIFVRDANGTISEVREVHKYNEIAMQRVRG